jgi:hypothetical protein
MAFHKTFDRIAPILMADFIKTFDLTPEQAAGFVGNFGAESSLISGQQEGKPLGTTETIRGHTGGIDWPQWTASRRTAFAKFVESKKLPYPSYEASWAFVQQELRTTHKHALDQIRKTTTLKAAVETAEGHYEKAGVKNWTARHAHAARALDLYLASLPPLPPPPLPDPVEQPTVVTLQRDLAALSRTVADLAVQVAKLTKEVVE